MKKLLTATFLATLVITPAFARPSSSSSFSRSYSRPSSSYSYSASRSYSAPSRSYSAPTRSYSAPSRSYSSSSSSSTVIHNHSSGGGFGSSFLGGMAGSVLGNALSNHSYGGGYSSAPPPAPAYSEPYGTEPETVVSTPVVYERHSSTWPWVFLVLGGVIGAYFIFRRKTKSVYTKASSGIIGALKKRKALYPLNPDFVVGCRVSVPTDLGNDTGKLTFVMDNVGEQKSTAIGKNDAFAHLYLGGEIDEDFVRVFVSSSDGGKPREAWAFSNVANYYGSDQISDLGRSVNIDNKTWLFYSGTMHGEETIITEDGGEITRFFREVMYSRDAGGVDEYLLIRNLSWSDPDGMRAGAQRLYGGVSIPISSIA